MGLPHAFGDLHIGEDGRTNIDVKLENETVWLTQAQMALLFDKDKRTISEHITNIFKEGELTREVVIRKSRTTTPHGAIPGKTQTRDVLFYNLDVIISVGYRVKSQRGTQFRIWANSVLKDYLIKGYAVKNDLVQQKYDDLKALVDVMGRTMGYLDSTRAGALPSMVFYSQCLTLWSSRKYYGSDTPLSEKSVGRPRYSL